MKSKNFKNWNKKSGKLLFDHIVFHTKYNRPMLANYIGVKAKTIICNILKETVIKWFDMVSFFENWTASTKEGTLEHQIAILCWEIFFLISIPLIEIIVIGLVLFNCYDNPYFPW